MAESASTTLEIQLLWPEVGAEPVSEMDNETCILAEKRAQAFRLYTQRKSVREVAGALKVSVATAARYVRHVLDAYLRFQAQDASAHLGRELGRLAAIEAELWEAWEKSKSESVETFTGRREGQSMSNEARVKRKQREGSVAIMKLILEVFDKRCQMLGLLDTSKETYKPTPVKLFGNYNPMDDV